MCDCLDAFDARIADQHVCVERAVWSNMRTGDFRETVKIRLTKCVGASRKAPTVAIPIFCPFCGERYVPATTPTQTEEA